MKVAVKPFGTVDGKAVQAYTLTGDNIEVTVINYGASVQSIKVKGREITLGYDTLKPYTEKPTYFGATVGRVANRIAGARFALDGKVYTLDRNDGENCLHGGSHGYDSRVWDGTVKDDGVIFTLKSADGDQGFPGELCVTVGYTVTADTLKVYFTATSDKDTYFAPTNHTFFNFGGKPDTVDDTVLFINADCYMPVDGKLIPTGELMSVKGTPFDFSAPKRIGDGIHAADKQLTYVGGGIDHNYALNGKHAATVSHGDIVMDMYTDLPGLQLYTGNFLIDKKCRGGVYNKHTAFCLEPQFFPNAVNTDGFKKPVLRARETATYYIEYKFKSM